MKKKIIVICAIVLLSLVGFKQYQIYRFNEIHKNDIHITKLEMNKNFKNIIEDSVLISEIELNMLKTIHLFNNQKYEKLVGVNSSIKKLEAIRNHKKELASSSEHKYVILKYILEYEELDLLMQYISMPEYLKSKIYMSSLIDPVTLNTVSEPTEDEILELRQAITIALKEVFITD